MLIAMILVRRALQPISSCSEMPLSASSSYTYAVSSLDFAHEPSVNGIVALLTLGIS
jgi:hypothetical protein